MKIPTGTGIPASCPRGCSPSTRRPPGSDRPPWRNRTRAGFRRRLPCDPAESGHRLYLRQKLPPHTAPALPSYSRCWTGRSRPSRRLLSRRKLPPLRSRRRIHGQVRTWRHIQPACLRRIRCQNSHRPALFRAGPVCSPPHRNRCCRSWRSRSAYFATRVRPGRSSRPARGRSCQSGRSSPQSPACRSRLPRFRRGRSPS